jgi:murein DD-endopeptidase MepM/ murein hydrolase activator NlpD
MMIEQLGILRRVQQFPVQLVRVRSEMFQKIPRLLPRLGILRRRWSYFFLLSLLVFMTCLGIGLLKQKPLQARNVQNTWKYASFPVENFQAYTSPFGYRISPVNGQMQFHRGLDMAAPIGSYVRNWWTGQVVELSDNSACGTSIKIQSGPWQHVYCHLMGQVEDSGKGRYLIDSEGGIQLWEGQAISVGARIGRVGMTGRTTGPHLHWALLYGNNYVDPALVLQAMFQQQASK